MVKLYPISNNIIGTSNENRVYDSFYFNIPDFPPIINNFISYYSTHYKSNTTQLVNYKYVKKKILRHLTTIAYDNLSHYMTEIVNENDEIIKILTTLSLSNPSLFEQFSRIKLHFNYIIKDSQILLDNISTSRDIVTITGFYNKLSNSMSQTVWRADGFAFTNSVESSIEESISSIFNSLFQSNESKLIASGREDCDVRMMGKGRFFALEIYNSKIDLIDVFSTLKNTFNNVISQNFENYITLDDLIQVTNTIKRNPDSNDLEANIHNITFKVPDSRTLYNATLISSRDYIIERIRETGDINHLCTLVFTNLRFTFRHKHVRRILQTLGECKKKIYSCLVLSTNDLSQSDLTRIETTINQSNFTISQGNPLRMTHRRSQEYRLVNHYKGKKEFIKSISNY